MEKKAAKVLCSVWTSNNLKISVEEIEGCEYLTQRKTVATITENRVFKTHEQFLADLPRGSWRKIAAPYVHGHE